jgi:hypothetical protein
MNMLSLTKCEKVLNNNGVFYTNEEIILIRNVLYKLAQVAYENAVLKNHVQNDSILRNS